MNYLAMFRTQLQKLKEFFFFLQFIFSMILLGISSYTFACNPPLPLAVTEYGLHSVKINWANLYLNDSWEIELVKKEEQFTGIPNFTDLNLTSLLVTGLDQGSEYCYKIRGICDGEISDWNGPVCFTTSLSENSICGLGFELDDPSPNQNHVDNIFYFESELFTDGLLGKDVFIQNVSLIIEHSWPSDLELFLISPNGKSVVLSNKRGFNSNDYGIPGTNNCDSTALFSDDACSRIGELSDLVGEFKPEESLNTLYDSSTISGNWKLIIRDNNHGHKGTLEYFNITLIDNACRLPQQVFIESLGPENVIVNWEGNNTTTDSLILEYGYEGFTPGLGYQFSIDSDVNEFAINGLESNSVYEIYLKAKCGDEYSVRSCPYVFETDCHESSIRDHFDEMDDCTLNCEENCTISSFWFNLPYPNHPWIVNSGETNTEGTGPESDYSGNGSYIYFESSDNDCDYSSEAIMETDCFQVLSNLDGCDMSFQYLMNGADVGELKLQITDDDGDNWFTLFEEDGDQGENWIKSRIDLNDFNGKACRFRFIAKKINDEQSERGDIALDEIIFYGSTPVIEAQYWFYTDQDGDAFGDSDPQFFCSNTLKEGFSRNNLDCDDLDPAINPDAEELPCNSIDENCNGPDDDLPMDNPMEISLLNILNESCPGSQDAEIILDVTGGLGPYLFNWSNGIQESMLSDIGAGIYNCTITDSQGCSLISDSFEIFSGEGIEFLVVDKSIVSCGGAADGEIEIDHIGGLAPFQYLWNNGDTTKNIVNLSPGAYYVTIKDSLGCEITSPNIELIAATQFTVGLQIEQPSCSGLTDASINILGIQNGEEPYVYLWSTGDTIAEIDDLGPGFYAVTVSDASYCYEVIDSIEVIDPLPLSLNIVAKDDVSCFGEDDGSIEIQATGGQAPYNFLWKKDGQIFSVADDLYGITAGNYILNINDNNGCLFESDTIKILQSENIVIVVDSIGLADCSASSNGSISIELNGGAGDYQYFLNDAISDYQYFDQLYPSNYSIVVVDKYGCKGYLSGIQVDYLNKPLLTQIEILEGISCFGVDDAVLLSSVEEASLPLDFNWSAGVKHIVESLSDSIIGLNAGSFNVTVTDADGCIGISNWIDINQPPPLQYEIIELEELSCFEDNSGLIYLKSYGGTEPHYIKWNNNSNSFEQDHLAAGYYTALLSDENGCELKIDTIFLTEPEELKVVDVYSNAAEPGMANGSAGIIIGGGVSPYQYKWDNNTGNQTGPVAYNLYAGEYRCTITDYNLCEIEALVIVERDDVATQEIEENFAKIFPNPAKDHLIIYPTFDIEFMDADISIMDLSGQKLFMKKIKLQRFIENKINLPRLPNGIYFLEILLKEGVFIERVIVLQ